MISQTSMYLLAGLVVGLSLIGCSKGDNEESAITGNTYPAPGLSFYANDPYDGISYDDSMYLGGRQARLYWGGEAGFASMDPDLECLNIYNAGNADYRAIATSGLSGYNNFYVQAGTQRYGSFRARQGDMIARASSWHNNHGESLKYIRGGVHLVCLMPSSAYVVPTGMFFTADANMGPFVNVNLQFSNMQMRFSQPYFGRQFRVAKQFNNWGRKNMDSRQRRNERDNLPHRYDGLRRESDRRENDRRDSGRRDIEGNDRLSQSRRDESAFESRSERRSQDNNNVGVIR